MSDNTTPLIGDFKGPPTNAPRTPTANRKPIVSDAQVTGAAGEGSNDEIKESALEKQPTKEELYQDGLQAVGITQEKAREIQEQILVSGYYEEVHKLGPILVKLRTRSYQDSLRALRFLEVEKPSYSLSINDLIARYNMAASLSQYGETVFTFPNKKTKDVTNEQIEKAFDERLDFIAELPGSVVQRLLQLVHEFDVKVNAVFAEGAPEDF